MAKCKMIMSGDKKKVLRLKKELKIRLSREGITMKEYKEPAPQKKDKQIVEKVQENLTEIVNTVKQKPIRRKKKK